VHILNTKLNLAVSAWVVFDIYGQFFICTGDGSLVEVDDYFYLHPTVAVPHSPHHSKLLILQCMQTLHVSNASKLPH